MCAATKLTEEQIEAGLADNSLVERFVSFYGDGAVYDSSKTQFNCRVDTEPDWGESSPSDFDDEGDYPDPAPSAIIRVIMPKAEYLKIWYYTRRDNNGPEPLSDAYEAAQIVALSAVETEVVSCGVHDAGHWSPDECDRLGGCFLCGGDHRNLDD